MTTAFQSSAFQNNGFQIEAAIIVIGTISRPIPATLPTIHGRLEVKERGDSCLSTATIGFSPVTLDNDLLLIAA